MDSAGEPHRSGRAVELGAHDALEHALLGLLPVLISALVIYRMYADGNAAVDFQSSFWPAGWRALHGLDPYSWTHAQVAAGVSFPYPAPAALALVPLALLSSLAASVPVTVACLLAVPVTLRALGVQDWRVYGAVALWAPVVVAWQTANFTLALMLGTALLWRWRERQAVAATLVACLVSIKPIMAPLWIWLLLTSGRRPAVLAVAIGVLVNAASWTLLGWHDLGRWLSLLSLQGNLRDSTGYSLISLATHLGVPRQIGVALMIGCGCALVAGLAMAARAGRELRAFGAAVILTIVISPQVDAHYLALLVVPLALTRPRLAWAWLAPLVLWACPATRADLWQILLWWAILAVLTAEIIRVERVPGAGERPLAALALGRRDAPRAEQA